MYIGQSPSIGNFQVCDAISVVNGQATYNLTVSSVAVTPETANHVLCSVNGVLQKPGSSFTIVNSTIVFSSNLATGDVINFVHILGSVLDLGVPSDDTVSAAKISANAVTGAKLNTDVISAQTALATAPADTDEFLVSDAGVLKRIDYSLIKGGGAYNLLSTTTVSSGTATVNITSDIDSTFKDYFIKLTDIHPSADNEKLRFQVFSSSGSPDTGSNYLYGGDGINSADTTSSHNSGGTTFGEINNVGIGNTNIESSNALMYLFNPSGTTFTKMIMVDEITLMANGNVQVSKTGIAYTQTVAITGIRFFMSSGNLDGGVIKLYGIT